MSTPARTNNIRSVSVLAKRYITKIKRSSEVLATDVEFMCQDCKDTGFVEVGERYKQCSHGISNINLKKPTRFF